MLSLFAPAHLLFLFDVAVLTDPAQRLPDRRRGGLVWSPDPWRRVGDAALALTWRVAHPHRADPYLSHSADSQPTRIYYSADDGWRSPLFHVPAARGGRGEPVLLAHGLGGTWRDFALDPSRSLAQALSGAGFSVYLFEHRGDRSALAPEHARPFTADDIATRDLDAALAAVSDHSGYPRVLFLGHGLGAQLLLLRLALVGTEGLAAAIAIAGAVRFAASPSAARTAGRVATLLPPGWVLPGRRAQQLLSPFVANGEDVGSPGTTGLVARARLRHAAGDLHTGVVRQLARWVAEGHLTDATGRIDVVAALRPFPTLIVEPDADAVCPPGSAEPAAAPLAGAFRRLEGGWGHLDPLLGTRAAAELHPQLVRFLVARRERCT